MNGLSASELADLAGEVLSKVLLFMDAPDHARLRGLVSKAFNPSTVERLRPRIAEVAAWTPLGAAWAVPGELALGRPGEALAKSAIALVSLALLLLAPEFQRR